MSSFRKLCAVRRTSGYWDYSSVSGDWKETESTVLHLRMSIQPLKMNEMEALPEGRRNAMAVKIYSDDPLRVADQTNQATQPEHPEQAIQHNSDIVEWLGRDWEVVACVPYQMGVIPHYKSYAVEVKSS